MRLEQHLSNSIDKYTGKAKDWILKAVFEVSNNESDAINIERFIKKQKSRNLILRLCDPEFIPTGSLAQLVRVPHLRDFLFYTARNAVWISRDLSFNIFLTTSVKPIVKYIFSFITVFSVDLLLKNRRFYGRIILFITYSILAN
ncbi:MAG: hypothetical protein RI922_2424 [Bacteroidota bacterium]